MQCLSTKRTISTFVEHQTIKLQMKVRFSNQMHNRMVEPNRQRPLRVGNSGHTLRDESRKILAKLVGIWPIILLQPYQRILDGGPSLTTCQGNSTTLGACSGSPIQRCAVCYKKKPRIARPSRTTRNVPLCRGPDPSPGVDKCDCPLHFRPF
jgi:hypothetical protein